MKRFGVLFLLFVLAILRAEAQTATVSGNVVDSDVQNWFGGNYTIEFNPNPSTPNINSYYVGNVPLSTAYPNLLHQTGVTGNPSGNFSNTVVRNDQITPTGSTWKFTFCPMASSGCGVFTLAITGNTDISSQITSHIKAPRFAATMGMYGYNDTEAQVQISPGSTYYNVSSGCQKVYDPVALTWSCIGATTTNVVNANINRVLNVTAAPYNAKGDCITDDHDAIQAALDAAAAVNPMLTVEFPTPSGGCYYTDTLTYQGQPLQGQFPEGGGVGLNVAGSIIRGKPGKDVFHIPDPNLSSLPIQAPWSIQHIIIQVDRTVDASASFPHRWPGRWTWNDASMTAGSPVITSATAQFTPSDAGQPILVKGAGPAGADLSTTILSVTPTWINGDAQVVTLASNASTTVSNVQAYISIAGIPVTQTMGNCGIAGDNFDGKPSHWLGSQNNPRFSSGNLNSIGIVGYNGPDKGNNTCGLYLQGAYVTYGLDVRNFNIESLGYGVVFGSVESCTGCSGYDGWIAQDYQKFDHGNINAKYPWISYGGNNWSILDVQLCATYGPQILNTGDLDIRIPETECQTTSGSGFRFTGYNVHAYDISELAGPGQTAYLDTRSSRYDNTAATGGTINLYQYGNTVSYGAQWDNGTAINDFGIQNDVHSSWNYFGFGNYTTVPHTWNYTRGGSYVSGIISADFVKTNPSSPYPNDNDLLSFPEDIKDNFGITHVTDSLSFTGRAAVQPNNNFAINTNLNVQGGHLVIGKHFPAGPTTIYAGVRCPTPVANLQIGAGIGGGNSFVFGPTFSCGSSGYVTGYVNIDYSTYAGSSVEYSVYTAGTFYPVYIGWVAVRPSSSSGGNWPTNPGIAVYAGSNMWGTSITPASGYLYWNGSTYSWNTPGGTIPSGIAKQGLYYATTGSSVTPFNYGSSTQGTGVGQGGFIDGSNNYYVNLLGSGAAPGGTGILCSASSVAMIYIDDATGNLYYCHKTGPLSWAWVQNPFVLNSITVNGHALSTNVNVTASDVGNATAQWNANQILGGSIPTLASGYLHYTGSAFVWDTPSGGGSGLTGWYDMVAQGGIDNTGATDVSSAIVTIINALSNTTPNTLYFAPGTYKIDAGILISATATTKSGIRFVGAGRDSTIFQSACTNGYAIWYNNTTNSGDNFAGLRFQDLQVKATGGAACQDGIRFTQIALGIIDNVKVSGFGGNVYSTGTIGISGSTITGSGTTFTSAMVPGIVQVSGLSAEACTFTDATHLGLCSTSWPTGNVSTGASYALTYSGRGITSDPGYSYSQYISIHDYFSSNNKFGIYSMGTTGGGNSAISVDGSAGWIGWSGTRSDNSVGIWLGKHSDTYDIKVPINNVAIGIGMDSAHANNLDGIRIEDNSTFTTVTTCNGGVGAQSCLIGVEISADAAGSGYGNTIISPYVYKVGNAFQADNVNGYRNLTIEGLRSDTFSNINSYSFVGVLGCPSGITNVTINNWDCHYPLLPTTMTQVTHKWLDSYNSLTGVFTQSQPACGDLSNAGTLCQSSATLPATLANASHKWLNSYNAGTGTFTQTQPASTDLSDWPTLATGYLYWNGSNYVFQTAGVGNTTSTALSNNTVPKANGANSIINSLYTDDGTTGQYSGTGGFKAPNGPIQATSFISGASSTAQAALPGTAQGMSCDEGSTAGVPATGIDYFRCDSGTHTVVASYNNSAESPVQTKASSPNSGTCTNQAVTGLNNGAPPTCTTISSSYVDSSIAKTGADMNTSNQVVSTHLSSPLPTAQGGTGAGALTGIRQANGSGADTVATSAQVQTAIGAGVYDASGAAAARAAVETCTNQVLKGVSTGGSGDCHTITTTDTDTTIAKTGADINTSNQVIKVNGNTPGGTCTNQLTSSIDSSARPTCTTATSAYMDSSVVTDAGNTTTTAGKTAVSTTTAGKINFIDFPERFYIPAANCNNATAGAGWSIGSGGTAVCRAGTNNLGGAIRITDTSSTFAQFTVMIPEDWDTATNPYIRFYFSAVSDTTNGHTVIPQIKVSCPTAGGGTVSDDATFSAAQSSSTVTFGASAVANGFYNGSNVQIGSTQMSGCIAGGMMIVQVGRATDTATGNINFWGADLTFPRLLTVQAN